MIKFKYCWILFTLVYLLIAGCAGTQQNLNITENPDKSNQQEVAVENDFDPLVLNDTDVKFPASDHELSYLSIDDFINNEPGDSSRSDEVISGYRVQLIATRFEAEARTVKREAVLTFEENVYTLFDNPYYKIRVGDCQTRYDANTLQELAVKKGFNEAWVVKTKVYRNPVLQHLSRDIQD